MIHKLKNNPLLAEVDNIILEKLLSGNNIIRQNYRKGITIHEQGAICSAIDIVCSGKLIAYSLSASGNETVIFEFEAGNVIGANLLFGDKNDYPMNIYCTEDCQLFQINKYGVKELLKDYCFVIQFVKSLSTNSQGMNKKISIYKQKSLRQNLLDYFTTLSIEQKSNKVLLPTTKKQLADYFGVQRPSLFRELKLMKDEGLISVDNRTIILNIH